MSISHSRLPIPRATVAGLLLLGAACTSQRDETELATRDDRVLTDAPASRELPVAMAPAPASVPTTPVATPVAADVGDAADVGPTPPPPVEPWPEPVMEAAAPPPAVANVVAHGAVGSEAVVGRIAARTPIAVRLDADACTSVQRAGETVRAQITERVTGSYGSVLPAGTPVLIELVEFDRSENVRDAVRITLRPTAVLVGDARIPIEAEVAEVAVATERKLGSAATRGAAEGAVVGAVFGLLRGKKVTEALPEAAAGAAAGAAVRAATANTEACVRADQPFTIRLTSDLELRAMP